MWVRATVDVGLSTSLVAETRKMLELRAFASLILTVLAWYSAALLIVLQTRFGDGCSENTGMLVLAVLQYKRHDIEGELND